MTYDEWMQRTRAGALQPRSAALRNVDSALKVYTANPSGTTYANLKSAVKIWQGQKNAWDDSIRNKTGAVTELDRYLAVGWPRPKTATTGPVPSKANVAFATAAAAEGLKRVKLAEQQEYLFRRNVSQTLTYRSGSWYNKWNGSGWVAAQYTVPTPVTFAWDVKMGFLNRGPVMEVRVRIKTKPLAGVSNAPDFTAKFQQGFKTQIESFWNCATIVDGKAKKQVIFTVMFVDDDDAYQLNVANPPPIPQGSSRQDVAQLQSQNTINLLEWAWSDRAAILHEFGHMVGNPDEYLTTSFERMGLSWSGEIYNQIAYTTTGIMNECSEKGRVFERNFALVLDGYKEWQRSLGTSADTATVVIERARLPVQNLTMAEAAHARRIAMGYYNDDDD